MRRAAGIVCFSVVRRASYSRTLSGHSKRGNVKSNLRIPQHGVPPLGGGAWANTMTLKMFGAIEKAGAPPAEAGTPNIRIQEGRGPGFYKDVTPTALRKHGDF